MDEWFFCRGNNIWKTARNRKMRFSSLLCAWKKPRTCPSDLLYLWQRKSPPSPAKNSQGGGRSHEFQNLRRQLLRKEIRNKCCDTWPPRRRVKRPCKNMEWLTIQWKGRSCRVENAIVCGEQPLLDDKGSHARRTPNESSRYVQRDRLDWGLTTKI